MTVNISYCAFAPGFMDVRIGQPIAAMRQAGANVAYHEKKYATLSGCHEDDPKILITQRTFMERPEWLNILKTIIDRGWLMVFEYDDYPVLPHPGWEEKMKNPFRWERFSACHAVQTTTDELAGVFLEKNPHVRAFPNQLYQMPVHENPADGEIRLFFGALNRKEAWQPLVPILDQLHERYANLKTVVIHDRELFDTLSTSSKTFLKSQNYDGYLKTMRQCDIALLPLHESEFTRYKSDIKFVEAAGCGLAVIASPTVYQTSIKDGKTGLIAKSERDWATHLTNLIENPQYRQNLGRQARDYVASERMLMQHVSKRLDWYRELWAARDEINARLYAEFPELKG